MDDRAGDDGVPGTDRLVSGVLGDRRRVRVGGRWVRRRGRVGRIRVGGGEAGAAGAAGEEAAEARFKLGPGEPDLVATTRAFKPKIGSGAAHEPVVGAAGVGLAQEQFVADEHGQRGSDGGPPNVELARFSQKA